MKQLSYLLLALAITIAACGTPVATQQAPTAPAVAAATEAPVAEATEEAIVIPDFPTLNESPLSEYAKTGYVDTILWVNTDDNVIYMASAKSITYDAVETKPDFIWLYNDGWRYFDVNNVPGYPEYQGKVTMKISDKYFPVIGWEDGNYTPMDEYFIEAEFPEMRVQENLWQKMLEANTILMEKKACFPMNDAGTRRLEVSTFTTCPAP